MTSFKTDCIEESTGTTTAESDENDHQESVSGKVDDLNQTPSQASAVAHSVSPPPAPPPPPYETTHHRDLYSQRIKFHDYFPGSSEVEKASNGNVVQLNMGWQASTPSRTLDDVRVEHRLTLIVKYVRSDGTDAIHTMTLSAPITLVTVSRLLWYTVADELTLVIHQETFRSEALQLPEYTTGTVIERASTDCSEVLLQPAKMES